VLWSNFQSMGFCDSSDFSSLDISADDFADFPDPQVIGPPDPVRLDDAGFSFRHDDGVERLAACMSITSKFHFYADDLQIYLSGNRSDLDGLIARVNEDLEAIHRWSIENGRLLNPAKSQANLVSNSAPELPLPLLILGHNALDWKDVVTDLGLLIDCRFRFGCHVTKTARESIVICIDCEF
jgi:hypothetical protein